jgi:hypothetical protein
MNTTTLWIPLNERDEEDFDKPFWFTQDTGLALPLCALAFGSTIINFDIEDSIGNKEKLM